MSWLRKIRTVYRCRRRSTGWWFPVAGLLLLGCPLPLPAAGSGVYFWHRQRNPDSDRAVAAVSDWPIYALRGELRSGTPAVLLRPPAVRSIPVFRLDHRVWLEPDFTVRFAELLNAETAVEIQLDCDVPEAGLGPYADFLAGLCRRVPGKIFSITLLPCHLRHRAELNRIFPLISYYVLQLHALEPPRDLPARYQLFDLTAAVRAVELAIGLGAEFKVALPTYAYRLHYSKKSGRFRRLSAENRPPARPGEITVIAAPDWSDVLQFRRRFPELPVIWFRLALPGDRLGLELENLRRLDSGLPPRQELTAARRCVGDRTELYWTNHGIPGEPEFTQQLGGGLGEAFFFHGVRPVKPALPGCVPIAVHGIMPGPGETLKIGEISRWIPPKSVSR